MNNESKDLARAVDALTAARRQLAIVESELERAERQGNSGAKLEALKRRAAELKENTTTLRQQTEELAEPTPHI